MAITAPRFHIRLSAAFSVPHRLVLSAIAITTIGCVFQRPVGAIEPAEASSNITAAVTEPVAPRGAVLMLPLVIEPADARWPDRLTMTLENGDAIEGPVVWLAPTDDPPRRPWTGSPTGMTAISLSETSGRAPDGDGQAYLLARLPVAANGTLRLGEQTLNPIWRTLPAGLRTMPGGSFDPLQVMIREDRRDRPHPTSPFAHWRWTLLADRMGMRPPDTGDLPEIDALLADHYAALWMLGLDRIRTLSPRIADDVHDLLTAVCYDGDTPFAAWVTDSRQLGELLIALLDFKRPDGDALGAAVTWLDRQERTLVWVESGQGPSVRLAIVNRSPDLLVASGEWAGANDIPLGAQLRPFELTRVTIDRLSLAEDDTLAEGAVTEANRQTLNLTIGSNRREIDFGPRLVAAVPPGVFAQLTRREIALPGLQASTPQPLRADHTTHVHLRKLFGEWELLVECLRPSDVERSPVSSSPGDLNELRGHEAVVIVLGSDGPGDAPDVVLIVPEEGPPRLQRGRDDGSWSVHRRSGDDRWIARIVLADTWLEDARTEPFTFGLIRTHAGDATVESAPYAINGWRPDPSRIYVDLRAWDDLPGG